MLKPFLDRALNDLAALLQKVPQLESQSQRLCDAMMASWNAGGKVLFAGNGGSCTDAMHFAEELAVRYRKNRRALAAIPLSDPSIITCAGNDFGYETIFSRQIEAIGRPGDVFIAMTTSGNSPNILRALEVARKMKLITCGMLGRDGGKCTPLCDIPIIVPHEDSSRIQEVHTLLYHAICEWVDSKVD